MKDDVKFRDVLTDLKNGNLVPTPDLQWWVEQARPMCEALLSIREYRLVGEDLLHQVHAAEDYLVFRAVMTSRAS